MQRWRRWFEMQQPDRGSMPMPEPLPISSNGLYGSDLLERRMAALHLDPKELASTEPELFRDLQRLCTSCSTPMRCAQELAQELSRNPGEPASTEWQDYCPNGQTLNMLSALESCHRPTTAG